MDKREKCQCFLFLNKQCRALNSAPCRCLHLLLHCCIVLFTDWHVNTFHPKYFFHNKEKAPLFLARVLVNLWEYEFHCKGSGNFFAKPQRNTWSFNRKMDTTKIGINNLISCKRVETKSVGLANPAVYIIPFLCSFFVIYCRIIGPNCYICDGFLSTWSHCCPGSLLVSLAAVWEAKQRDVTPESGGGVREEETVCVDTQPGWGMGGWDSGESVGVTAHAPLSEHMSAA